MQKIISVLLCFCMLFSFTTFAAAEDAPQLNLTASKQWSDDKSGLYACFEYSIRNCPDFESCQLIITYNPEVLQYVNGYPLPLDDEVRKQTICTVLEPGTLQVIGNDNDYGSHEFDPFCLKVIGEGDTDITVELVSFKTADGEVESVKFDADIQNFTVEEAPQLNLTASKASADAFSAAPGQYVNFICSFWNCSYFESFEILITYNPEVLEYSAVYPLPKTEVVKHAIDCTVIQPGKLQVIGNNTCGYGGSNEFDPFCLKVIGEGDTDISVELVSFKTADGEVENVKFDADIQNFTVTQEEDVAAKPTVCITAQNAANKENAESLYRWDCLLVSVANAENFMRCEINVTLNTPPYRKAPVITELESPNCANSLQKQEDNSYTITVGAPIKNEDVPFVVYAFVSEEDVPLEFTVNSVRLYTADGEIDRNNFVLDERRLNGAGDFVRYDLDGNEAVTAEDARLALRFAVGLETATKEQRYAAGLTGNREFTSAVARDILRAAVGLPA